ncbi:hypothetical protein [Endozoicomonas sp. Mp262]|uniref:hypothetical protein n=1 Tax=Endozoicomonas sp. Mp262 TaxID=2919499 RepID=UPI0021D89722
MALSLFPINYQQLTTNHLLTGKHPNYSLCFLSFMTINHAPGAPPFFICRVFSQRAGQGNGLG